MKRMLVLFHALLSIPLYLLRNLAAEWSDDNSLVPSVLVLVACWWGISHSEPSPSSLFEEEEVAIEYLKSKCNALAVMHLSDNTSSKTLPAWSHWESRVPPPPSTDLMEKYCLTKVKERKRRLLVITTRCEMAEMAEMEQSFFEATFDEGGCGNFLDDLECWEEGMSTKAETVW
eukprot:CAMPEP_0181123808 /NCGR_PEP_ID=MMETSP1071-20121207/26118_1 /TAXON_ID=35127 /ORGANISM="Thalassiosira sp., Strain NH16" /LENGTH=173 /DNA_ID=CAMNT_0023209017 /DNA_START=47 /DNA_END=565 /DNA_ORIENTATION=-